MAIVLQTNSLITGILIVSNIIRHVLKTLVPVNSIVAK
jgi:hypothetical protein